MKRTLLTAALLLATASVQAASGVVGSMVPDGSTITCDAAGVCSAAGGGGGSPGGSTNDVQYKAGASTFGGIALTNGQLVVGQTGATPLAKTLSGDATLTAGGVMTIANLAITNAKIANGTIDLAAKVTGLLPGANGGTGNGFFAVSGPAGSLRTFAFPNASATVLTDNAAVTVAQGGTGLASGTSGGVPYYSSSTTIASSAALTANLPVIGGGAGAAPAVGTRSGNTTAYVTTTGTQTSGDCVKIDASGNHIANGSACGGGSSTVTRGAIAGLALSNDGSTPNTVLDIAAGQAADTTVAAYMSPGAFTKSTAGAWASGTGGNGMGNGLTIAASTWYHVCLGNNGGTPDYWFDTSASCANRPSGISDTKYRRVGSFKTNGSSNIVAFKQVGETFYWAVPVVDANAVAANATASSLVMSAPLGIVTRPIFAVYCNTAGGTYCDVRSASEGTAAASNVTTSPGSLNKTSSGTLMVSELYTNTSSQLYLVADAASMNMYLTTRGWVDDRGRFD